MGSVTPPEAPSRQGRSARLYVRAATATPGAREPAVARLDADALAGDGAIAAFDVVAWPRAAGTAAEEWDASGLTYRAFGERARHDGVCTSPPFAERVPRSRMTGATDERLVAPELCFAVSDRGEPVAVYPCSDGASATTVRGGLDALAAGRLRPGDGPPAPADGQRSPAAPDRPDERPNPRGGPPA